MREFWKRNAAVAVVIAAALIIIGIIVAAALSMGGSDATDGNGGSGATSPDATAPSSGTSDTSGTSGTSGSASAPTSSLAPTGATKTVTDSLGRAVVIPETCSRIAALDSFAGEALVMAGAGPLLVAVPNGVSSDVILQEICPGLADVMTAKSSGAINIESIAAASPDVALIRVSTYYTTDEVAKLDKLGLPYLVIDFTTVDGQIAALELLQSLLPSDQAARMGQIVATYRNTVARVEACAAAVPEESRVRVLHAINSVTVTDGGSSIGADWVTRAGAVNVSAGEEGVASDRGDYTATLEQIFVWDPDVVVCNEVNTVDYLLSDSKWVGLRAVMEGKVYNIPIGAGRWGQRGSVETWFAMEWLGCLLYPEEFAEMDLRADVEAFYGDVLDITVDDDLWAAMCEGRELRKHATGENAQNP